MDRRQVSKAMALGPALAALGAGSAPSWTLGPFGKADAANPVLGPGAGTFVCPMRGETVAFEEKDVFNPAADDDCTRPTGLAMIRHHLPPGGDHQE